MHTNIDIYMYIHIHIHIMCRVVVYSYYIMMWFNVLFHSIVSHTIYCKLSQYLIVCYVLVYNIVVSLVVIG